MGRWHYPRWRRILMQVVLCAIFAGSVALAAMVTNHRRSVGSTRLAGVRWFGRVGVRAPVGWSLEMENQGPVLLVAQEPDVEEKQGRRLIVRRNQLDTAIAPAEYLKTSGILRGTRPLAVEGTDPDSSREVSIAGTPGILRPVLRGKGIAIFAPTTYETEWIACAVRPTGLAITLQLECPDNTDPSGDEQALREIASAIDVRDAVSKD